MQSVPVVRVTRIETKGHFTANSIVTTSYTSTIGNGLDLPSSGDFAYVGPGVMLGTLDGAIGSTASDEFQSVRIAGSVFGAVGVRVLLQGYVTVPDGGSNLALGAAVNLIDGGCLACAGSISGSSGVVVNGQAETENAGIITGDANGIHADMGPSLVNPGVISGRNSGVFTSGATKITNLGRDRQPDHRPCPQRWQHG